MTRRRFAVVAGGGTGGHVIPALSVARAIAARGHERSTIELVGSRRGQEAVLLAEEGFSFTLLGGRGIARSLAPKALLANVGALVGIVGALARAVVLMGQWRPSVVVSAGGYASFPACFGAVLWRRPLVLVNIDAVPGLVHRMFGRFAAASAVAFADTPLRHAVITGTPVRKEIEAVDRSTGARTLARTALGLPTDRLVVAVFGGSLGARRINAAARELATRWADRGDLAIYHVVGRRDWDEFALTDAPADVPANASHLFYRTVAFEERMDLLYSAADLFVCRAGAMTVAELAIAGVPAVLIPLPGAPGDHQTKNAQALVNGHGAILLPDGECDAVHLDDLVSPLLAHVDVLVQMGAAAHALSRPGAADNVAEVVLAHVR